MQHLRIRTDLLTAVCVVGLTTLASCASSPNDASGNSRAQALNKTMAVQNDASCYTEVFFNHGSYGLDNADKRSILDMIARSLQKGKIDEIKVISWSDQKYPARGGKTLASGQVNLADRRNQKIKNFIESRYPDLSVSVYNMAKRPNSLETILRTADLQTKRSYEEAGIAAMGEVSPEGLEIKSKALIFSVLKEK